MRYPERSLGAPPAVPALGVLRDDPLLLLWDELRGPEPDRVARGTPAVVALASGGPDEAKWRICNSWEKLLAAFRRRNQSPGELTRGKDVFDELPLGRVLHRDAVHAEGAAVLSRLRPVERPVRVWDPREVVLKVLVGKVNLPQGIDGGG